MLSNDLPNLFHILLAVQHTVCDLGVWPLCTETRNDSRWLETNRIFSFLNLRGTLEPFCPTLHVLFFCSPFLIHKIYCHKYFLITPSTLSLASTKHLCKKKEKKIIYETFFKFKCYFKSDRNVFHVKHQMKSGGLPLVVIINVQGFQPGSVHMIYNTVS